MGSDSFQLYDLWKALIVIERVFDFYTSHINTYHALLILLLYVKERE